MRGAGGTALPRPVALVPIRSSVLCPTGKLRSFADGAGRPRRYAEGGPIVRSTRHRAPEQYRRGRRHRIRHRRDRHQSCVRGRPGAGAANPARAAPAAGTRPSRARPRRRSRAACGRFAADIIPGRAGLLAAGAAGRALAARPAAGDRPAIGAGYRGRCRHRGRLSGPSCLQRNRYACLPWWVIPCRADPRCGGR